MRTDRGPSLEAQSVSFSLFSGERENKMAKPGSSRVVLSNAFFFSFKEEC